MAADKLRGGELQLILIWGWMGVWGGVGVCVWGGGGCVCVCGVGGH